MTITELRPTEVRPYFERLAIGEVEVEGRPGKFSTLHGRAVPYGTYAPIQMTYLERHAPNSFKRSTDQAAKGLPLLLFHDARSFPVGVSTAWEHRSDGLYGTWRLNDSPEAQRAASAAYDGEMTGLSVGFQPIDPRWEYVRDFAPELGPEHMHRVTHHESRLVEVSLVSTPAFSDSEVLQVRTALLSPPARSAREFDKWQRRIELLRQGPGGA